MEKRTNRMLEIYTFLKQAIAEGVYVEDDLLPTDLQLAEQFGVSRPTVARAVKKLQAEGQVGRKPGYGTYIIPQPLAEPSSAERVFGLLIPALGETEIFEPICGQIANLADSHHFSLLWGGGGTLHDRGLGNALQLAEKYVAQKIDGVFFAPLELIPEAAEQNARIVAMFTAASIPVVLLDSDIVPPPLRSAHDLIGINNINAGFTLARHLIDRGCQSIGFITRPNIAGTVHMRLIGAREAVLQAELPHDSLSVIEIDTAVEAFAIGTTWDALDGLICYNDALAAPLLVELDKHGVNIPRDLKICAFDDVKYANLIKIPLTTYRQPCRDIGTGAVDAMLARIRQPDAVARMLQLQGELIVRTSTEQ
ncbi:MAG TPA: GntR family transcriptional regulator [Lentisphaeria bacterium]|nr:GntR family transcriptional regulator [Lentisphaeria bacterium]